MILGWRWPAQASSMAKPTTAPQSPSCAKRSRGIWSAASLPTALPVPAVMTAGMTTSSPSPAKAAACALVQHPAHGRDGGAPERPCLPAPTGAPVGAVSPEAAALLHAARRGGAEYSAAHLLAGNYAKPVCPLPRCGKCRPRSLAHWCSSLHSPVRLQPQ